MLKNIIDKGNILKKVQSLNKGFGVLWSIRPSQSPDVSSRTDSLCLASSSLHTFFLHVQVYAEGLIHLDAVRTLQGSPLSFICGGSDNIVSTTDQTLKKKRRHFFDAAVSSLNRATSLLTMESVGSFRDTSSLRVGSPTGSTAC